MTPALHLFIVWAIMMLHPVFRPVNRAWIEQLWLASAAFAPLPVLNALTTDRHLGVSLWQRDWIFAGFDLTMLAFGLAFASAAGILTRRSRSFGERESWFSFGEIKRAGPAE